MADAGPGDGSCVFCGGGLTDGRTGATDGAFCSDGCRTVHETLADGTERRGATGTSGRSTGEPASRRGPAAAADAERTFLRVDGLQSATDEAFLEAVAADLEGVEDAEASYVTETVRVDHDPGTVTGAELEAAVSVLGYTAYRRSEAGETARDSESTTRREREVDGVRRRRDEKILGLRYAAGIVFGAFLLVPYVALLYPTYLAAFLDGWFFQQFEGAFQLDSRGGFLFLRIYLVMTGIVLIFTGLPVLRGAYVSLRMRRPTTDLFVAAAAVSAYLYGTLAVLAGRSDIYYDLTLVVAATVTAAVFYESTVKRRALGRLTDLTVSQVDTARRLDDDGPETVPVGAVSADDRVLVREGERIPVDGTLVGDDCTVDEAVVTGESLPVLKREGDAVVGGSVVTGGAAVVEADGPASGLDRIAAATWDVQSARHGATRRVDRLAARLLPVVGGAALVAGVALGVRTGSGLRGALAALAALFVASPWALGLATPLSVATSIRAALRRGIVVFDETVFERLRAVDVVVFDKTGTLTTGNMEVTAADAPPELLAALAPLERRASHPVARALVEGLEPGGTATDGGVDDDGPGAVESFRSHGTGVEGVVDGTRVLAGTVGLFDERGWSVGADLRDRAAEARGHGRVPVVVGREGAAEGLVVVGDEPRDGWERTLSRLDGRDVDVAVLTGDHADATGFLRGHDAVTHVFAGVPPSGKAEAVRRLGDGRRVAMVGDGTNDAPALAAADLGISLGSGTAMAADAADLAVVDDDLGAVETAFDLAGAARRRIRQNTALAFAYNAVVVPVAVAGLLNPLFAMAGVAVAGGLLAANSTRALR